jgi:division protein CdvB (Snf7/Vps24/ESCRT-III family)
VAEDADIQLARITGLLEVMIARLEGIETRIDTLEDQLEMAAVADIDGTLDEVRAEVRSIKDEML